MDFENECMTLSRTILAQFLMIDQVRVKNSVDTTLVRSGSTCGRGRHYPMNNPTPVETCITNGVNILDTNRNYTTDAWDKLQADKVHLIEKTRYLLWR